MTSAVPVVRAQAASASLGLQLVAGVDHHVHRLVEQRRPVLGRDEILDRRHAARRVDVAYARRASACALAMPSVEPSACTWRLMFDSATWSRSISTSARDSTARQRLDRPRADAAESDDRDARGAQSRVGGIAVEAAQAAEAALEVRGVDGRRLALRFSDANRSRPAWAASDFGYAFTSSSSVLRAALASFSSIWQLASDKQRLGRARAVGRAR